MNQEAIWTTRYLEAGERYLFGTEPNRFLAQQISLFKKGETLLSVADGEGRNSTWLAQLGLIVTAVEISPVAVEKARRLAREREVVVDFVQADMLTEELPHILVQESFDWVVGIFIQFADSQLREKQFALMKQLTRPGGRILLQGYTPRQLEYRTGGPSALDNLYTQDLLEKAFSDWTIEELTEYEEEVDEGIGHKGHSALIGLVARKPTMIYGQSYTTV